METMKQSGLWSSLGTHGSVVVIWCLCIYSSGETRKFDFLNQIWPWKSGSIATQNNKDLNQGLLHLWFRFGDPSLNGSRIIARTSKWLTHRLTHTHRHTHTHTDAGDDNTRRPRVKNETAVDLKNEQSVIRLLMTPHRRPLMYIKPSYLMLLYRMIRRGHLFIQLHRRPIVQNRRSMMRSRPLTTPRRHLLITGSALTVQALWVQIGPDIQLHRTIVL